jgi:hypothetical protein
MGLTSKKVLLLAFVLAVVLFGLTVWLWPRLGRRGVVPILGRVGILLGTQLSMIAALGLWANYSFGFYASWADLFGENTTPGVVVDHTNGHTSLQLLGTMSVGGPGGGAEGVGPADLGQVGVGGGPQQGLGQPLGRVDVLEVEPALVAHPRPVDRVGVDAVVAEHPVAGRVDDHPAADRARGARRLDLLEIPRPGPDAVGRRGKSAHRADQHGVAG